MCCLFVERIALMQLVLWHTTSCVLVGMGSIWSLSYEEFVLLDTNVEDMCTELRYPGDAFFLVELRLHTSWYVSDVCMRHTVVGLGVSTYYGEG